MNQGIQGTEVNPFVKRVATVKEGAVVIFKYDGYFEDQEAADKLNAHVASKMGAIPFLILNKDFDVCVLQPPSNGHAALIA